MAFALLAAAPGLPGAGGVAPGQPEIAGADNAQLLLFAVQLDNVALTEALTAYGDPADPLIPVGELSRLLDLPLEVQPSSGLVTGRLGENQRALTIDLAAGKALIGGRPIALIPPDSKVTDTDIYLRASLLQKLLPITIMSSPEELVLTLTAREKLPIQSRRDRAQRISGIGSVSDMQDDVLRIATPYRWLGRPAFDFGIELGTDSGRDRPTTRFEGRVAADLAQTSFTGYVATNDAGKLSSARLRAERRSADGNLFGPLHATYAAAGDVYSPALVLGPRSEGGMGFNISSARIDDTSVFQKISLRGEVPIGYDVELYVNDVLRNGQQGNVIQGRYDFTDVPLVRGRNVIRIVLYGPRGERSEQTRIINVGGGALAAGQTVIDAGIVAQGRPVVPLSTDAQLPGQDNHGSLRAVINLAHGLTPGLTVSAGLGLYSDMAGARHQVLTGGLRTSLLGMAVQGDFAKDLSGGMATSLGAAGRLGSISFLARHVEYSGIFTDEANAAWDPSRPLRRYSELSFDLALPLPGHSRLPVSSRIDRAEYADGGTSFSARSRTTVSIANTLVALGVDYSRRTGPGFKDVQFTGNVAASRFVDYKWQLRASADYDIKAGLALRSLSFTADRAINERYSLRFGAGRTFGDGKEMTFQAGVSAHLRFGDLTFGGDYSTSQKRWRLGLQLNFGVAYDPLRGGYHATPPGPANGGSAAFQSFIDSNDNGLPDPGETPVIGVVLQGAGKPVTTDAQGRAFVTGLGDGGSAILRADVSNADTVFVSSPPQSIAFTTRAGNVARVYYPMVPCSEVVFRLKFRQRNGTISGLAAVRVQLVPETATKSAANSLTHSGTAITGMTEFDGTAVFDGVKPGKYRLELDEEQAANLGMRLAVPVQVTVGTDGRSIKAEGDILISGKVP